MLPTFFTFPVHPFLKQPSQTKRLNIWTVLPNFDFVISTAKNHRFSELVLYVKLIHVYKT